MQCPDHAAELGDLLAACAGRRVAGVRCEEAEGVVAPVVRLPTAQQRRLAGQLLHRQQLDARDAECQEVLDGSGVPEPGVRAAQVLGHAGVGGGEALDVRLVDHRVGPRHLRSPVALPVVAGVGRPPRAGRTAPSRGRRRPGPRRRLPGRGRPGRDAACRRWRVRTGRRAACRVEAVPVTGVPRARARGSRSAAPAGHRGRSRARRRGPGRSAAPGVSPPSSSRRHRSTASPRLKTANDVPWSSG